MGIDLQLTNPHPKLVKRGDFSALGKKSKVYGLLQAILEIPYVLREKYSY